MGGWGESLLGFTSNGGIAQWLPIFMFVILFGLSMDYHVFILSRVREAYDRGMSTADAVAPAHAAGAYPPDTPSLRRSAPPKAGALHVSGAGGRTRTDDPLITNELLYQLSYSGQAHRE